MDGNEIFPWLSVKRVNECRRLWLVEYVLVLWESSLGGDATALHKIVVWHAMTGCLLEPNLGRAPPCWQHPRCGTNYNDV